ncbi:Meiosis protein SPO22/ZIP4 like domain containing protein [Rhypophila sp. PSN 637]
MAMSRPLSRDNFHSSKKAEKHVESALEFTKTLLKQFSSGDLKELPAIHQITQEIRDHVDKLHTCQERYLPGISGDPEIDEMGTKLWNVCTSKSNGDGNNHRVKRLVVHGRVLALHLLVLGKKPSPKEQHKSIRAARELIRLMKLVLKAGRDCVELLSSTSLSSAAGAISAGNSTAAKDWREDRKKAEKDKDTKLATMVMEIAAESKGVLQDFQGSCGKNSGKEKEGHGKAALGEEEVNECNCLEVEYFILRTALSWIDKRPDVAEHMYTKAERLHKFLTPNYAEKLADVLFEIGKSFLVEKDFLSAVKWLERANEILNTQSLEKLSREGVELRLAILQATVTAYLGMETPSALEKARKIVDYVESELGSTKLIVSLLRLEVLRRTPPEEFDDEAYSEVLRRMIRTFNSTDAGLKLITHHIQKLQKKSPGAACAVMDELINRLREVGENLDWMEMVVVQRMWMIQHAPLSLESFEAVRNVLSLLKRPFGPMACMATQGLMWRKLKLCYHGGLYDLSEKWGHLALHPIFDQCGNQNRSKIERKLLMCALARNDMDAAVSVIQNISNKNCNDEPMTAYLAFKVAIRVKDRELAERCLEAVGQTKEHIDYLGACIAESQKAEDIESAISGLKKLHDKYERKATPGGKIHLPALFRCSIRLLNCLLESPEYQDKKENIVNELCLEFEAVVEAVKHHDYTFAENLGENAPSNLFTVDELEWFSRNAYNLALKNTSTWDLRCVIRLLNACVEIIGYFPDGYSGEHTVDLSLKMLFSRFIMSSALISLARVQDDVEQQRKDYEEMRKHVAKFDEGLVALLADSERYSKLINRPGLPFGQEEKLEERCLDPQCKLDMGRKLATLLVFDFEAALALGKWDDLGGIVAKIKGMERPGEKKANMVVPFQAMADCLLRAAADAPVGGMGVPVGGGPIGGERINGQVLYSTMRKLVNEIWLLETFDAVKLAKYTRCLFQATLPLDDTLAMNLLDEACKKARELGASNTNNWPDEELEWMATVSFNHAIDCYGAREMERSRLWATKAIELAHYCRDEEGGGLGLERAMQKKFASMKFDRRPKPPRGEDIDLMEDIQPGSGS